MRKNIKCNHCGAGVGKRNYIDHALKYHIDVVYMIWRQKALHKKDGSLKSAEDIATGGCDLRDCAHRRDRIQISLKSGKSLREHNHRIHFTWSKYDQTLLIPGLKGRFRGHCLGGVTCKTAGTRTTILFYVDSVALEMHNKTMHHDLWLDKHMKARGVDLRGPLYHETTVSWDEAKFAETCNYEDAINTIDGSNPVWRYSVTFSLFDATTQPFDDVSEDDDERNDERDDEKDDEKDDENDEQSIVDDVASERNDGMSAAPVNGDTVSVQLGLNDSKGKRKAATRKEVAARKTVKVSAKADKKSRTVAGREIRDTEEER